MIDENQCNNAALIETVRKLDEVQPLKLLEADDEITVLAVPKGKEIKSIKPFLDEYLPKPERLKGTARMTTIDSFVAHVNRFKDPASAIFCAGVTTTSPRLIAVLDYHGAAGAQRWTDHRCEYEFPLSDEWKAWKAKAANTKISQADFAEFLEDRVTDVLDPTSAGDIAKKFAESLGLQLASPQRLLSLSKGLSVRVDSRVTQAVDLSSGETQFNYSEQHKDEAGSPLKIPGAFVLSVPVFRGDEHYQVPVRLRYRVDRESGVVSWSFALQRVDRVFEDALSRACKRVQAETELPLFYGTPEV